MGIVAPFSEQYYSVIDVTLFAQLRTANRDATMSAFQQAVAQYAGHTQPIDPELVKVEPRIALFLFG